MKLKKESIKEISLIVTGILLIGVGYFNYSLDENKSGKTDIVRTCCK